MYCRTFFSFPEFKISDIFNNPTQPRGLAEKNVWNLRRRKICVAHKKGIRLKGIAFKGFACKNVLPTNVSVKKGICLEPILTNLF
jgi:hypothetical protein